MSDFQLKENLSTQNILANATKLLVHVCAARQGVDIYWEGKISILWEGKITNYRFWNGTTKWVTFHINYKLLSGRNSIYWEMKEISVQLLLLHYLPMFCIYHIDILYFNWNNIVGYRSLIVWFPHFSYTFRPS